MNDGRTPSPYFIGIALPPELSERIDGHKWQLHNEVAHSLKPLVPHVTLLHPPSLKGVSLDELLPKIRDVTAPYLPLTVSLDTIDNFGDTVLYIGARSPELEVLQSELVRLLPAVAQEIYYQRGYIPHVTIVQTREPHALDIATLRERTEQEIILPCEISVDTISYFEYTRPREYNVENI